MGREISNWPRDKLMFPILGKSSPTCKFGEGQKEERKIKVAQHGSSLWVRVYVIVCQLTCPWGKGSGDSPSNQRDSHAVNFINDHSWEEPGRCPSHQLPGPGTELAQCSAPCSPSTQAVSQQQHVSDTGQSTALFPHAFISLRSSEAMGVTSQWQRKKELIINTNTCSACHVPGSVLGVLYR